MSQQVQAELGRIVDNAGPGADHARIALGESCARRRLAAAISALAIHRGPRSSICPSDAARAVGGENWRDLMNDARDVAGELAEAGEVEITQGGTVIDPEGEWRGPIRIRMVGP